jgi:hypothetical protein
MATAGAITKAPVDAGAMAAAASRMPAAPSSLEQRKAAQRAAREAAAQEADASFRAAMQAKRDRVAAAREAAFRCLYDSVLAGLQDGRHGMTAEATAALEHATAAAASRRRALHAAWSTQVFQRLSDRVQTAVAAVPVAELEASLCAASDAYLRACNAKGGVYRDVVIATDYNPFERSRAVIRVPTDDIVDPLKRDLLRTQEERGLLSCSSGSSAGTGGSRGACRLAAPALRQTLDVRCWGAGAITATPYGRCITADGVYHVRPAAPASLAQVASRVHFDDFTQQPQAPYRPSKRMQHTSSVTSGGAAAEPCTLSN